MGVQDDAPVNREGQPKRYRFVSSQSPLKRPDPDSEVGRSAFQDMVDDLAAEFVGSVAGFRAVSDQHVLEHFGQGAALIARKGVKAGMADAIGSFESTIAELQALARQPARGRGIGPTAARSTGATMSVEQGAAVPEITAASLVASHPAIVSQFRNEGREEGRAAGHAAGLEEGLATGRSAGLEEGRKAGADAERARILGIEAQALPGHDALIAELKADGVTTPEQAAIRVIRADRERGDAALGQLRHQADRVPPVGFAAPGDGAAAPDSAAHAAKVRELVDTEAAAGRRISYAEASARVLGK